LEVLSGLYNGVFLIYLAFNVFFESIERIYEPEPITGTKLLLIAVLGLMVNLVGLKFFHQHAHGG
jgi:Co/Zn/Cd efflux system component